MLKEQKMLLFYLSLIETDENRDIFGEIYEKYLDWMLKTAYHYVKSKEDAEDVVHDVFMEIIKNDCSIPINDLEKTKSYLFICIRNRAIKLNESRSKRKTTSLDQLFNIPSNEGNAEDEALKNDMYLSMLNFINSMSPKYKDVLTLHIVYDKTAKEISKIICAPTKTIETRLRRGKIILKERFKDLDI
ncbi:MAG: sigma-70 family RNA polymerase sigma factor [Clostridia bacterium]|nr:sigma-70 family RNA polymerase sigma factor [Clostridia bacterium]